MKDVTNESKGKKQHVTRRARLFSLLPLFMALLWAGCKQEAQGPADIDPAGTYTLASVDGKAVPCVVQHEGHELTIQSGTFIIHADGTCSSKMVFTAPSGAEGNREVKATYTRQGSKLTMKWEGAGTTTGTVDGDNFTMENEGMILAYRK
jgi:hypothetical protein